MLMMEEGGLIARSLRRLSVKPIGVSALIPNVENDTRARISPTVVLSFNILPRCFPEL